jgi:hypothetical protein
MLLLRAALIGAMFCLSPSAGATESCPDGYAKIPSALGGANPTLEQLLDRAIELDDVMARYQQQIAPDRTKFAIADKIVVLQIELEDLLAGDKLTHANMKNFERKLDNTLREIDAPSSKLQAAVAPVKPKSTEDQLEEMILGHSEVGAPVRISLDSQAPRPRVLEFDPVALSELRGAAIPVKRKFVDSLKTGAKLFEIDPAKIRLLPNAGRGELGTPFEVIIINHGHQRLFGCFKDGVFRVLRYDPHAPEQRAGTLNRYGNLCK